MLASLRANLALDEHARADDTDPARLRLVLPMRVRVNQRGGRKIISHGPIASATAAPDLTLIWQLGAAHALVSTEQGQPLLATAPATAYARPLLRLAFRTPKLQAAILAGRQTCGVTLDQLLGTAPALLW